MDQSAGLLLGKELRKRTNRWDHICSVCDKAMTRGTLDHLRSKNHWTALWNKIKEGMPPPDVAPNMDRPYKPWVQSFRVPGGELVFNHLTAGLKLDMSGGPQMALSGSISGPWPPMPAAPMSMAKPSPASSVVRAQSALEKCHWRRGGLVEFHGGSRESFGGESGGGVLDLRGLQRQRMKEGTSEHLASKEHWSNLKDLIDGLANGVMPPDNVAESFGERPWVQKFGNCILNHLTGGLQSMPTPGQGGKRCVASVDCSTRPAFLPRCQHSLRCGAARAYAKVTWTRFVARASVPRFRASWLDQTTLAEHPSRVVASTACSLGRSCLRLEPWLRMALGNFHPAFALWRFDGCHVEWRPCAFCLSPGGS